MIVDTHAHLDFENYNDNLNQIIERAKENDVKKIITAIRVAATIAGPGI